MSASIELCRAIYIQIGNSSLRSQIIGRGNFTPMRTYLWTKTLIWVNKLLKSCPTLSLLIFGCTPFGSDDSPQTFLVAIHKLLALRSWVFLPLFLCKLFKLLKVCRFLFPNSRFQPLPKIFYWIEIRTHSWPFLKQSIFSFSTIPECFRMCALGLCLAGGPMIFDSNQVFLHWVGHFALKSLDNSQITWFLWYGQGLQYQMQQSSPTALWILHHACWQGVLFFVGFIEPSVNKLLVCIAKKLCFCFICPQNIFPEGLWFVQVLFGKD